MDLKLFPQNLIPEYSFHGVFICTYIKYFKSNKNICDEFNTVGYTIEDEIQALDINNPFDLFIANTASDYFKLNPQLLKIPENVS